MAKLDPTKIADWQIAAAAEENMKTVYELGDELGLEKMELLHYGHYVAKLDYLSILERLKDKPDGKYIEVTAVTPTPLGEGKSTTTMGLTQGMGRLGKSAIAAIRQPSSGPTFNIKGSAAGGGLAQCIPLTDFSLGLTGDIDAINNAHNLAMVAVTSRMQHEFNYGDDILEKKPPKHEHEVVHGLLRPGLAGDRHRHRRQDGRIHDAEWIPDHRLFGGHGHPGRRHQPG